MAAQAINGISCQVPQGSAQVGLRVGCHSSGAQRMAELWFSDDTMIVLDAGNRSFRVPLCILAAQSAVFQGLLGSESPNSSLSLGFDRDLRASGCPVVKLVDSAEDVEHFIRAVYDSGYFEPPPSITPLEQILGILSLSSKYQIHYLQIRALNHLMSGYPFSLSGWDSRNDLSTFPMITDFSLPFSTTNISRSLAVLETAFRVKASWILPAAYYECCRYDLKDLMNNPKWKCGLDEKFKNTIITGHHEQGNATRAVLGFLYPSSTEQCLQPHICANVRIECARQSSLEWPMNNPLGIWEDTDWDTFLPGICDVCLSVGRTSHAEARKELWMNLPQLYDLPPWKILLGARAAAMHAS